MARIGTDIAEAARLLQAGGLVAVPTETVYGLAANAYDAEAVLGIFEAKRRPAFDPLIVHARDRAQADRIVRDVPRQAEALMDRFWPGPLTLVLPKRAEVPDIVTSGLDTVGIRMPAHPLTRSLLDVLPFPLAAPSANPFGYVSPTTAQHVADQLGDQVPYILDGGPCAVGVESTILGWENGACVLYRPGGVPVEDIEAVIGRVHGSDGHRPVLPVAPGMLASHYAPRTPVVIGDVPALLARHAHQRVVIISFQRRHQAQDNEVLSPAGDLHEAARALFAALRRADASGADLIVAELFPDEGLGRAINDRLRRAAA